MSDACGRTPHLEHTEEVFGRAAELEGVQRSGVSTVEPTRIARRQGGRYLSARHTGRERVLRNSNLFIDEVVGKVVRSGSTMEGQHDTVHLRARQHPFETLSQRELRARQGACIGDVPVGHGTDKDADRVCVGNGREVISQSDRLRVERESWAERKVRASR